MLTQVLGGVGLFLLGMLLLTDGLKAAAGAALKRILVRFTGRPASAFLSGLTLTAMVQSSSATTLATIGFVSAGLLTFSQAIGVVIGGSVGTTTTGWLVSLLGLKLSVGKAALPFIGVGALMRLTLKGRPAALGLALAGFGLIFVGIDTLQAGMSQLAGLMRPDALPSGPFFGRLLLVGIGLAMTVIMQSSSAAIATTITAFHTGAATLDQALSLVIGASIGTTVTAALASIGASVPARRTALAHILFNSFAGLLGFLLQPLFIFAARRLEASGAFTPGAAVLALFHTSFNLLGALIVLPVVHRLARLVSRMVPDRGPALTRHLDASLAEVPEVAIEAARRTLADCAGELLAAVRHRLSHPARDLPAGTVRAALDETRRFRGGIPPFRPHNRQINPRLAVVHTLDHLDQLSLELARIPSGELLATRGGIDVAREELRALAEAASGWLRDATGSAPLELIERHAANVAEQRRSGREAILEETARGGLPPESAADLLDALRWIDRTAYHAWRAVHHLSSTEEPKTPSPALPGQGEAEPASPV